MSDLFAEGEPSPSYPPKLKDAAAAFISSKEMLDSAKVAIESERRALLDSLQATYEVGADVTFTGSYVEADLSGGELSFGKETWAGTAPGYETMSCIVMNADLVDSEDNPDAWPRARFTLLRTSPRPSLIRIEVYLQNLVVPENFQGTNLGGRSKATYLWKPEPSSEQTPPPQPE